jgi:two-component system response regulator DctR
MSGCIVLDMRMTGMSGLDCFDQLRERESTLPVIFLTGHGDVPIAVATLQKGAFDFFEKPFNDNELVTRIGSHGPRRQPAQGQRHGRLGQSPPGQPDHARAQIMELVLAGKFNKVIADELNISMRTVEVHRANLRQNAGQNSGRVGQSA